jgi:hypothetical protein
MTATTADVDEVLGPAAPFIGYAVLALGMTIVALLISPVVRWLARRVGGVEVGLNRAFFASLLAWLAMMVAGWIASGLPAGADVIAATVAAAVVFRILHGPPAPARRRSPR